MKRILLIVFALFIYTHSEAQKEKTFEACKTTLVKIIGTYVMKGDSIVDTTYHSTGRNTKYPQINEYITLHDGHLREIYAFYRYLSVFLKNSQPGATELYLGNKLQIITLKGVNYVNISGMDKDSGSFTTLGPNNLANVMAVIEQYAKSRHIKLR